MLDSLLQESFRFCDSFFDIKMRCTSRNCKNVKDIDPVSKLCPRCLVVFKDTAKRVNIQERQQNARDLAQNQNRDLGSSPLSSGDITVGDIEPGEERQLFQSVQTNPSCPAYPPLQPPGPSAPVTLDSVMAEILNISAKVSENDAFRKDIRSRIEAVEAKVGDPNEVSERLGLAVRFLPQPPTGYTDLDMVRQLKSLL